MTLDPQLVRAWAGEALAALSTEFPYAAHHVSRDAFDTDVAPRVLHPAFHGAYDWHSSVHLQWSLIRLLELEPLTLDRAGLTHPIRDVLDARLTPAKLAIESSYLRDHPLFERPYGWAWAAMLGAQTWRQLEATADPWVEATTELLATVAELIIDFLPRLPHPVRHGVHANTAFSLSLLHQAFTIIKRTDLVTMIEQYARATYGDDVDAPLAYEPSGTDFLSPTLSEAELMARVLGSDFGPWLQRFLPDLVRPAAERPPAVARLLTPTPLLDTADGQLAHAGGLALSKAWQLTRIAGALSPDSDHETAGPANADPAARHQHLLDAASDLRASAFPLITDADFASTHWLLSFALLDTLD